MQIATGWGKKVRWLIMSMLSVRSVLTLAVGAFMPLAAFGEPLILKVPPASNTAEPGVANPAAQPSLAPPLAPAPVSASDPARHGEKILILPFQAVKPGDSNEWMGRSIQQSLAADLLVMAPDRVVTSDQFAATTDEAIALGRHAGAHYVIAGGFVTGGHDIRITGQLLDVETGTPVTGLKVTGESAQIFHMEDGLAMQVKVRLFPQQMAAILSSTPPQQPQPPAVQPQAPVALPPVAQPRDAGCYQSLYSCASGNALLQHLRLSTIQPGLWVGLYHV